MTTKNIDEILDVIPIHEHTASDGITDTYWDSINARTYLKQAIKSLILEERIDELQLADKRYFIKNIGWVSYFIDRIDQLNKAKEK